MSNFKNNPSRKDIETQSDVLSRNRTEIEGLEYNPVTNKYALIGKWGIITELYSTSDLLK